MTIVNILLTISLLAISVEDWKERQVSVYWFILIFLCLSFINIDLLGLREYLKQYLVNLMFITLYFLLLQVYIVIKHQAWVWMFDKHIGYGDLVFVLCVAGYWALPIFVIFLIFSIIVALLLHLIIPSKNNTVPLAGFQSLVFLVLFYFDKNKIFNFDQITQQFLVFHS